MEIPDLIKQRLGGEEVESAVNLGDEDLVCFTAGRTLIYRAEGLISDESVTVYDHDIERLDVSEGRRKTTFTLAYIDRNEEFTVARDRADPVLKRLLAGVLHASDVTDNGETVVDVFRFSELTLVITDSRLVRHIGASVWDEDYVEYPFADVTGLEFEEGSVATQIVLSVKGRPQRIKAPTDEGRLVRDTLEKALFAFYDVDSLDQLNATIGTDDAEQERTGDSLSLDDTISPLVEQDEEDEVDNSLLGSDEGSLLDEGSSEQSDGEGKRTESGGEATESSEESGTGEGVAESPADDRADPEQAEWPGEDDDGGKTEQTTAGTGNGQPQPGVNPQERAEMQEQLAALTEAVGQQNELLEKQQQTIEQLIEELRKQQ